MIDSAGNKAKKASNVKATAFLEKKDLTILGFLGICKDDLEYSVAYLSSIGSFVNP